MMRICPATLSILSILPFTFHRQLIANLVDRAKPVLGIDIFKRCEGGVESEGLFNIIPQNLPDQVVVSSELTRFLFLPEIVFGKACSISPVRYSSFWAMAFNVSGTTVLFLYRLYICCMMA